MCLGSGSARRHERVIRRSVRTQLRQLRKSPVRKHLYMTFVQHVKLRSVVGLHLSQTPAAVGRTPCLATPVPKF